MRPKLHELACHGLFSVESFPYATDVSKIIVAINAHKRALELRIVNSYENDDTAMNNNNVYGLKSQFHTKRTEIQSELRPFLDACADRY